MVASLVYLGPEAHTVISHLTWGPIEFGMWAPGITLNPRGRWTCSDIEMTRGVPILEALGDLGNGGKTFGVAHGVHEITATAEFHRGSCAAPMDSIATSIVVAVSDGPDDIPLLTDVARQVQVCLLVRGGGRLVTSDTGLSVALFDGTLRDVVWPTGYTARRTPKGAALIGRDGHEIAHEGDEVEFDATSSGALPLWPCGDVNLSTPTASGASAEGEIKLTTGSVPTSEDGTKGCLTALGSGILAVNPRTDLGFVDEDATSVTDVVWPDGYTAQYQDGRGILIDESGGVVATVGDKMSLGGGYSDDNVFHVCGAGITDEVGPTLPT